MDWLMPRKENRMEKNALQKNIEEIMDQTGVSYDEALQSVIEYLGKDEIIENLISHPDRSLSYVLSEMIKDEKEPDNFDIFEDRVKSLLSRWRNFRNKHSDMENVVPNSIKGCLNEILDEFTKALYKE